MDKRHKPTTEQEDLLIKTHNNAMNMFKALSVDMDSKPQEQKRPYNMVLLYMDDSETICPAYVRTASLMGFLESTDGGWKLAPLHMAHDAEYAKEIDGYFAVELFRNYSGIEDIHKELKEAVNRTAASLPTK
jgi:hypothetical protein